MLPYNIEVLIAPSLDMFCTCYDRCVALVSVHWGESTLAILYMISAQGGRLLD